MKTCVICGRPQEAFMSCLCGWCEKLEAEEAFAEGNV
jgi:hypothetical protein